MAVNNIFNRGVEFTIAAPIAANSGVGPNSGDPLIIGTGTSPSCGIACVAETSYTPPSGAATGNITVKTEGVYQLSVLPAQAPNGTSHQTLAPGDRVFAGNDGKYDATTGVYYGFTLCAGGGVAAASGIYFGNVLDALAGAGTPTKIRVRLKNDG